MGSACWPVVPRVRSVQAAPNVSPSLAGSATAPAPKGTRPRAMVPAKVRIENFFLASKPWSPNRNHSQFRYKRVYRRASSVRVRGRVHEPSGIPSVRLPARLRRGSVQRPLLPGSEEVHERQRVQSQREMRPAWRMRLSAAVLHRPPRRKPLQK